MTRDPTPTPDKLGLLANGTSARWDVSVDEYFDRAEWLLEIEGPQTYLVFQLRELSAVREALDFLRSAPLHTSGNNGRASSAAEGALILGRFGSASVSLVWDNENFPRCFLVIGPKARSTFRLSLDAEDIQMLAQALEQVVEDLSLSAEQKQDFTSQGNSSEPTVSS
jgi:hypothetical protein